MNYLRPEICERLTERYVLGTMPWRTRRRFDRVVDENEFARSLVYELEATLLPGIWSLSPVMPSDLVWRRIARDIGFGRVSNRRGRRSAWPGLAAALAVATIFSSFGWWQAFQKPPETVVETVVEMRTEIVPLEPAAAVISDADGNILWLALVYDDMNRADIEVLMPPEVHADKDYELWILDGSGVPASMGLLPQSGDGSLSLDSKAVAALQTGNTLAVSLEPLGGSPEAAPTGPVLFTAALLNR
jgi:anti-sigma-K factor RskA